MTALTIGLFAALVAAAPQDEPQAPNDVYLRAERVLVRPGHELENAVVWIRDGVIRGVGEDVAIPEGATVHAGEFLCSGFVDPWASVCLDEESLGDQRTSAGSMTRDAADPWMHTEYREDALLSGVLAARIQIGGLAEIGGVGAMASMNPGSDPESFLLLPDSNVSMTVGVSRSESFRQVVTTDAAGNTNFSFERGFTPTDVFDRIKEADRVGSEIESGRKYREDHTEYGYELEEWQKAIEEKREELEKDFKKAKKKRDKDKEEAEEKGKDFKEERYKEDKKPKAPKVDPDAEVMARVADGELPLVVEAHRPAELRALLEATRPYDRLRLIIAGGTGALAVAEELAERRIPVIVLCSPTPPEKDEWEGHDLALAGRLEAAGVPVLLGTGGQDATATRDLPLLAALAVGHGLSREAAMRALTVGAAQAFDVADKIGTVRRGRPAHLLLWTGDPLDPSSRVRLVLTGADVVIPSED